MKKLPNKRNRKSIKDNTPKEEPKKKVKKPAFNFGNDTSK